MLIDRRFPPAAGWVTCFAPCDHAHADRLFVTYPDAGFKTIALAEDFHRDLQANPCGGSER